MQTNKLLALKMTENHSFPITPPPELVRQWLSEEYERGLAADHVAIQAAQWGSDQELEACCEYLVRCAQWEPEDVEELRTARRPKPPSLKEQALADLDEIGSHYIGPGTADRIKTIRRALEQLDD